MAIKDDEIKVLQLKLQHRPTLSNDEWSVWEHKTWNIHRGVLCWRPMHEELTIDELATTVREKVERSFKRSWWRGFGFGVLVVLDAKPDAFKIVDQYIENPTGCGGSFGEILCWEIHANGMTFEWLAKKWGVNLPMLGELIWDAS